MDVTGLAVMAAFLADHAVALALVGQVAAALACACFHRYRMLAVLVFTTVCTLVGAASQEGLL